MQIVNSGMYTSAPPMEFQGMNNSMYTNNANHNPYNNFPNQQMQPTAPIRPVVDPRQFDTPTITLNTETTHMPNFSAKNSTITVDNSSDMENEAKKSPRKRKKKTETSTTSIIRANDNNSGVESVDGDVVDSTIFTYQETNNLLHDTLNQIDAVNAELVREFQNVKNSRTMKNKYMVLNNLSENIGAMLSNRISTIKEINNCITKSNDLDYKKYKDIQAAKSSMNDDKYIADLYQAFIQNPQNQPVSYTMPPINESIVGSNIIRANIPNDTPAGGVVDEGYLNYISNITPEQNLMRYENNPNVKQVVVYDESTGAKFFQMMDMSTGEAIPNVPVYDDLIMQDTTLNLNTMTAKNLNLRESFPIVKINSNKVTSQY
jgi:hypothetical protein